MDIADGEGNLSSKLFLVELHPDNLVGESLVKQSVDLGAARQLEDVHDGRAAALDGPLEVLLELLDALEHGLRLDRRVVRSEVLVLFHLLLQREDLLLEAVAQPRQSFTNVILELLVEDLLQVGRAHAIGDVAVRRMTEKS